MVEVAPDQDAAPSEEAASSADAASADGAASMSRTPAVTAGVAVLSVLALAFLAVSGYFGYMHWQAERAAQQRSQILEAASQGVVNLTTMDFERADDDVQKVLDGSAGEFRDDFEARSKDLIAVMQEAQVKSVGEVRQAAIERQDGDSADVLVAVTQRVSNAGGAADEPRGQRMRVTMQLEDGTYKIVKAGFVQ
ncbi:hypothetical protein I1A62_16325 [Rhodococcus sp. USK10]|uniref:hypothetical protein n=1 Tax=Rhodococcus sp. USK10 TaxID=2789739 RepID=UPI001C5E2EB1|nr:hypothetical protein [Rhodococcus sp. USK10]QYB05912.1 hypothetical protein I1A62_16325 [Rhodococcus sp. USK10]